MDAGGRFALTAGTYGFANEIDVAGRRKANHVRRFSCLRWIISCLDHKETLDDYEEQLSNDDTRNAAVNMFMFELDDGVAETTGRRRHHS